MSATTTLTGDSTSLVAAFESARLAMQRSRAALAETKAAMLGAGGATDDLKAKAQALNAGLVASRAALERAKTGLLEMNAASSSAKDAIGEFGDAAEHGEGKLHSLARGMRFSMSAALTMEGQFQHLGHAIVGVMMGMADPMMLAAMGAGLAIELIAKHFKGASSASDEARANIEKNLEGMAEQGKASLEKLKGGLEETEKALRDFGLDADQARKMEAANNVGRLTDMKNRSESDLNVKLSEQKSLIKQINDLALAGHQSESGAMTEQLHRNGEVIRLLQTRLATIPQELGFAEQESRAADQLAAKDIEALRHKERTKEVLEEIKKSNEKGKETAKETAEWTLRIAEATEKWASAAAEAVGHIRLLGGAAPMPFSPPPDEVLWNGGVRLAGYQANTLPMPAGVGVKQPQLDSYSRGPEFSDVVNATTDELNDLAMTVGFLNEDNKNLITVIDQGLSDLDIWNNKVLAAAQAMEEMRATSKAVGEIGSQFIAGHGAGAAGSALGGAAGSAVGALVGDPTGIAGGAIGSALGDAFGSAIDSLAPFKQAGEEFGKILGDLASVAAPLAPPLIEFGQVIDQLVKASLPLLMVQTNALSTILDIAVEALNAFAMFGVLLYDINPVLDLVELAMAPLADAAHDVSDAMTSFNRSLLTFFNQLAVFVDQFGANVAQVDPNAVGVGACFTASTLVATPFGPRRIDEIEIGDIVTAKDEKTGEVYECVVEAVHVHEVGLLIVITLEDGTTIETTHEHPFRCGDMWRNAGVLDAGDVLVDESGQGVVIVDVRARYFRTQVYNLTVAECHTYFVGARRVWVHNKDAKHDALAAAKLAAENKNTDALNKLTDAMQNMPQMYKVAGRIGDADRGRAAPGLALHVHGDFNLSARDANILKMLQKQLMSKVGVNRGLTGDGDDDKN